MPTHYEGSVKMDAPGSGFKAAAGEAVKAYEAEEGVPPKDSPVLLRVADMYIRVGGNPIGDYVVILTPDT
jgi:hypothetical protein